jgi:dCMP deaminase
LKKLKKHQVLIQEGDVVQNDYFVMNGLLKAYVLHAEANAISKIARSHNSSDGATLYVTASPCIECSKLIIQAGIKRVIYGEQYRIMDGVELLQRAGIEVVYLEDV